MTNNREVINKSVAALAESVGSIFDEVDDDKAAALAETFEQFQDYLTKSYDEGHGGDSAPRFSQRFSSTKAASEEPMTRGELKAERAEQLRAIVKAHGITALAKGVVAGLTSIDEHELTALATEDAQRAYPELSPTQAFEKVYLSDPTLREAITIAKAAEAARYFDLQPVVVSGDAALDVNDPNEAIAQLKEIGRRRWPSQSEAKQFERAFTDPANAEIAAKAHRRPAATSIFPHPR
jgi:hypothetical protein